MFRAGPISLNRRKRIIRVTMTGAGAIAQLARGVENPRTIYLLVGPRSVVTRMTAAAVWLKRREPPGHKLCVALMAIGAREVIAVILRFVR